jgi:3-methyl-2-oxobutanoate hydroxymethyltransferase
VRPVHSQWIRAQKNLSKLSMLTAYDYPTAKILDEAGVDILLVGDSLGTVLYGEPNTLCVTLEDVLRHTVAVTRAVLQGQSQGHGRAFVVADLPFMTYQINPEQALASSGRLLKEAHAQAVKLEGGREMAETVRRLTLAGIPVMGHIGLTPQSIHAQGIYRMHGKTTTEAEYLLDSARAKRGRLF